MTVAVLVMLAAAAEVTVQLMLKVALPPLAIAAPVQVPLPVTPGAIVPGLNVPADGVKLQLANPAGRDSCTANVSVARMALGPALLTVKV